MADIWTPYEYANVSGFYDLVTYANTTTNGFVGTGIVLSLWSIIFIVVRRSTDSDIAAFSTSSFLTFMVSIPLWAVGLVDSSILMVLGIMTGISVLSGLRTR